MIHLFHIFYAVHFERQKQVLSYTALLTLTDSSVQIILQQHPWFYYTSDSKFQVTDTIIQCLLDIGHVISVTVHVGIIFFPLSAIKMLKHKHNKQYACVARGDN